MKWEQGFKYVGKAIEGQVEQVDSGSLVAKIKIEVTKGPCAGQRMIYQGWITGAGGAPSPKNAQRTSDELRAMGATLARGWTDLTGLGTKEVEFTAKGELATDGPNKGKTFWRAAFVGAPKTFDAARRVTEDHLAGIAPPPPPGGPSINGAAFAAADDIEEASDPGQDAPNF